MHASGTRIGLVGIGLVGTAITERLRQASFEAIGFDIDPARAEPFRSLGGAFVPSLQAVAEATERIVLAVFSDDDVDTVLWGPQGLLRAARKPRIVMSVATGDPERITATAARAREAGVAFIDATISGSSSQVRNHDAVMMVGGADDAVAACEDLFVAIAKRWFHVGPAGAGARAKLAVNLVLGLNRAALAEGLFFAERMGLDLPGTLALLKASAAYSQVMDIKGARMLARDYAAEGRLRQHAKDVGIILAQAERLGAALPLSRTHQRLLAQGIADGDAELDNSAILETFRRQRFG